MFLDRSENKSVPNGTRFLVVGRAGPNQTDSISSIDNLTLSSGGITIGKEAPLERYLHKDHLGSIVAVTDNQGVLLERFSYDAWGKRRKLNGQNDPAFELSGTGTLLAQSTHHGFTGHEMLDEMSLVHMNGRIYDPMVGRFISADPNIDTLYSTQGLNSYSYVLNNPLNATDPSGYWSLKKAFKKLGSALGRAFKTVVKAHIDVVSGITGYTYLKHHPQYAGPVIAVGCSFMATPAGTGACMGIANTAFARSQGGTISQSLRIGLINGAIATASGHAAGGIEKVGSFFGRVALNGFRGGVTSAALGGDFRSGFISGAFSSGAAPFTGNVVGAAVVGGLSSKLVGGSFAEGAVISVVGYRFGNARRSDGSSEPGPKALIIAADVIGKVWTLPNTILGVVYGGVGYLYGLASGSDVSIRIGNNAMEFISNPLVRSREAFTLGNAINYGSQSPPEIYYAYGDPYVNVGRHERAHTYQAQVLGVFYIPVYLTGGMSGPDGFIKQQGNPMENSAQQYGSGSGGW